VLPIISFIIPSKNEEKNIIRCLESISNIDYPRDKIEIIVVDNGSTDKTISLAEKIADNVFVSKKSTIGGLRNIGAKHAKGEILAFIDADVTLLSKWAESAVLYFLKSEVAIVGASPNVPASGTSIEKLRGLHVDAQKSPCEVRWICSMNMLIRKEVFEQVGGFSETLITCEDVDLGYRVSKEGFKIIRDKKMAAIHLGEAKTFSGLFKKEKWRAYSNYDGVSEHGIVLHELPSLLFPFFNIFLLASMIFSVVTGEYLLSLFFAILLLAVPIIRASKVAVRTGALRFFSSLILFQSVYMFARIVATTNWLFLKITELGYRRNFWF